MFCHNCGSRQTDEASFCAQCGARQIPDTADPAQPADSALAKGEPASPVHDSRSNAEARLMPGTTPPSPVHRARGIPTSTIVFWLFTVAWVSLVSLHAYANWPRLSKLESAGIWDFVIRATAPVVLFWLVTRYFQLAARLRNSDALNVQAEQLIGKTHEASEIMRQLAKQAQAVVDRVEAEIQKLREQEKARVRAVQPRWEVNGRIAHEKVHEINLRNAGAAATSLSAAWDKSLRMAVILSDTTFVDRGGNLTIKAMFLDERIDDFDLKLHYNDGANEARVAHITVSNMEVSIRQDEV
jgi:zinc ribbon protein